MQLVSDQGFAACVHCGACCLSAPCGYGEARGGSDHVKSGQPSGKSCIHVIRTGEIDGNELMTCGIAEYIVKQPGAEFMPAFGAGCCRTLGNTERYQIIEAIKAGCSPTWDAEAQQ